MNAVLPVIDENVYRHLIAEALPHVIHSEQENERYITELEALHSRRKLSPEEKQLAELLTLLIETYEDRNYRIEPAATPLVIVRELMDANGLKQSDMIEIFGAKSVASEVLSGKRALSKTHIKRLSQRFNVSPEVFFSA